MSESSPETEARVLEFFAADEFCLRAEIESVVALSVGSHPNAEALVTLSVRRGWLEVLAQDDLQLPPLLHLTDAGYAELERRRRAT